MHQSYYVDRRLFAGEYPGDKYAKSAEAKLKRMHHFGVRHFVDLTGEGELRPYRQLLPEGTTYLRFPISDVDVPKSIEDVHQLIDEIEYLMQEDGYTYLHCWGGVGRTGTIVACYKARQMKEPTLESALAAMRSDFSNIPKASYRESPETQAQIDFVRRFVDSCNRKNEYLKLRTKDRIRGSLMAGAAGDALGYSVEFMSHKNILSKYGDNGIAKFDLTIDGKALVSDDTQMTLFTANGLLMGLTRGCMRGIGGQPENYVDGAYLDWYYTQTGKRKQGLPRISITLGFETCLSCLIAALPATLACRPVKACSKVKRCRITARDVVVLCVWLLWLCLWQVIGAVAGRFTMCLKWMRPVLKWPLSPTSIHWHSFPQLC